MRDGRPKGEGNVDLNSYMRGTSGNIPEELTIPVGLYVDGVRRGIMGTAHVTILDRDQTTVRMSIALNPRRVVAEHPGLRTEFTESCLIIVNNLLTVFRDRGVLSGTLIGDEDLINMFSEYLEGGYAQRVDAHTIILDVKKTSVDRGGSYGLDPSVLSLFKRGPENNGPPGPPPKTLRREREIEREKESRARAREINAERERQERERVNGMATFDGVMNASEARLDEQNRSFTVQLEARDVVTGNPIRPAAMLQGLWNVYQNRIYVSAFVVSRKIGPYADPEHLRDLIVRSAFVTLSNLIRSRTEGINMPIYVVTTRNSRLHNLLGNTTTAVPQPILEHTLEFERALRPERLIAVRFVDTDPVPSKEQFLLPDFV